MLVLFPYDRQESERTAPVPLTGRLPRPEELVVPQRRQLGPHLFVAPDGKMSYEPPEPPKAAPSPDAWRHALPTKPGFVEAYLPGMEPPGRIRYFDGSSFHSGYVALSSLYRGELSTRTHLLRLIGAPPGLFSESFVWRPVTDEAQAKIRRLFLLGSSKEPS